MALLEEFVLEDTIKIKTTPEQIFGFLTGIVDDDSYRSWHKKDHVSFRWLKGQPWSENSILYAEEYIHGKLHKLKFKITKIKPFERIEYVPLSPLVRKFLPRNEFVIKQEGAYCFFTASGVYRVGWIGKTFFKKAIDKGLSSVKKHMREEGENLKEILEKKI
jgi:hypothetical protein